jgi:hypothetical protein
MHKARFSDPGVVGDLFGSALDLNLPVLCRSGCICMSCKCSWERARGCSGSSTAVQCGTTRMYPSIRPHLRKTRRLVCFGLFNYETCRRITVLWAVARHCCPRQQDTCTWTGHCPLALLQLPTEYSVASCITARLSLEVPSCLRVLTCSVPVQASSRCKRPFELDCSAINFHSFSCFAALSD